MIPKLVIDSTQAPTELCILGRLFGTDKSPLNNAMAHRHPQTAVYSMLFAPFKHRPIHMGEIGTAGGSSVHLWRHYFTQANLSFFDCDISGMNAIQSRWNFPNTNFTHMDVRNSESIRKALSITSRESLQDILLDDSSHDFEDQIRIIHEAVPFLKPGGILIIEDLFRKTPIAEQESRIADIEKEFSMIYAVDTEHVMKHSPGWDNDRLLVLIKK